MTELATPTIDRIVDDLRALVLSGRFAAESRLAEEAVAHDLGVSRTPVRQAMTMLEREGLLRRSPRRGFRVRVFTIGEVADSIAVRGELEAMAVRLLAERGLEPAGADRLDDLLAQFEALIGAEPLTHERRMTWAGLNLAFHDLLVQATGNVGLVTAYEQVKRIPLVSPRAIVFDVTDPERSRPQLLRAHEDHLRVIEAVRRRRGPLAAEIMRDHALRSGDNKRRNFNAVLSQEMLVSDLGAALVVADARDARDAGQPLAD